MKYLLDNNVCSNYLVKGKTKHTRLKIILESYNPSELAVCSVVYTELLQGSKMEKLKGKPVATENIERKRKFLSQFTSLPFDDDAAEICSDIRAQLMNEPIGPHDSQIAAIALVHDLTVVTHNVREFSRVPNLKWEDWES